MTLADNYLQNIKSVFQQYQSLAEKAMDQLSAEQLFLSTGEDSNSIAIILKHLHGNMLSRWTDFLTTDGEKPWRKRDDEFENDSRTREELLKQWEEGWACVFAAIDNLSTDDLIKTIYIRGEAHSVTDAINRQIAHYSYHVGQVVFAARQFKNGNWKSLSIPKKIKS